MEYLLSKSYIICFSILLTTRTLLTKIDIFKVLKTNWSEFIYFISPESGTLAGADPRFQVKKKLVENQAELS
jgi:hypothetical protein